MAGENFNQSGDLRAIRGGIDTLAAGAPTSAGATEAKQDTIIGHVDGVETTLTAISGKLPTSPGAKTGANSLSIVPASDALFVQGGRLGHSGGGHTYSAWGSGYTAYATPTDMLTISGAAGKIIAVTNMGMFVHSTAGALQTFDFVKRSTANSGGTSTSPTPVSNDSASPAPSATLFLWTAAPTLGALVGVARTALASSSVPTSAPSAIGLQALLISYPIVVGDLRLPIILRGTAESLSVNYRGAALTGGFTAIWFVEWVEL